MIADCDAGSVRAHTRARSLENARMVFARKGTMLHIE
jgi:hypothetical protein